MIHKKRRACFLCDSETGKQLFEEEWEIVGVGRVGIGVRICSGCGLVLQDPVVPTNIMREYCSKLSNYTNPGRKGLPSKFKIGQVDRQLSFLTGYVPRTGSVFQVGCSDGYTLHRFKEAGWTVMGVDPSPSTIRIAKTLWGLDLEVGFFEDYPVHSNEKYDLIVLTHILEHTYTPAAILEKCASMLFPDGDLLIEVPALVEPNHWPPGYFSLEHLNYFSPQSMTNMLRLGGFGLHSESALRVDEQCPVLMCVARPEETGMKDHSIVSDFERALQVCNHYMQFDAGEWHRIDALLHKELRDAERMMIWGAGIHTSQLIARTNIRDYADIECIVDSDSQKRGLTLGKYPVKSPDQVRFDSQSLALVISSYASEEEIYNAIVNRPDLKAKVIRLYTDEGFASGKTCKEG